MACMEPLTDEDLHPSVAAWHLMPRLVGLDRPSPWLSACDLGAVAAGAFADRASYVGSDLPLAADIGTLSGCRATWRRVTGRNQRQVAMPVWLVERLVGPDLTRRGVGWPPIRLTLTRYKYVPSFPMRPPSKTSSGDGAKPRPMTDG